ncbi:hypothetical protein [Pseudacidovorax intermedius]|uniref:hypothetical protein n=1 Tax=Pseudacidovorax intermedius TaxID=433924 RepID=UPI0026EA847F|nr:hypothetical protein [Pseudacidovorax intermedius]
MGPALAGLFVAAEGDLAQQASHHGPGLGHGAGQRLAQVHHQPAVRRSDLVCADRHLRRLLQRRLQRLPLQLCRAQARGQGLARADGHDGVDDPLDLFVQLCAAPACVCLRALVSAVQLGEQAAHCGLHLGHGGRAQ